MADSAVRAAAGDARDAEAAIREGPRRPAWSARSDSAHREHLENLMGTEGEDPRWVASALVPSTTAHPNPRASATDRYRRGRRRG